MTEMDELARYNKERWEELARANVAYSRPWLALDAPGARALLDPYGVMGEVAGKDVLCLASGGGQQSAAFGLLGANVTVFDLSETQLERDRQAAAHHRLHFRIEQGDMRDLSRFAPASFDVVWHAYSINFVPDAQVVFDQVTRVLRPGGRYRLDFANPFVIGLDETHWTGVGYPLGLLYEDGAEILWTDPDWTVEDEDGMVWQVRGPREFRHSLSTVVNGLIGRGFVILGIWEEGDGDPKAAPGTWAHLKAVAPPWITLSAVWQPGAATGGRA